MYVCHCADLFWTNPQYGVNLKQADDDDEDGQCTMVVSLMQKSETMQYDELFISFFLYKVGTVICYSLVGIVETGVLLKDR